MKREEASVKLKQFVVLFAFVVLVTAMVVGFPLKALLAAEPEAGKPVETDNGLVWYKIVVVISMAFVVAAGSIAAAYAVAKVGSAALGAVTERPEMMGRSLVYVALAEGIAIWGLLVAVLLYRTLG